VPLVVLALLLFAVLASIALLPLSLIQRYRVGTARRVARRWVASINLFMLALSIVLFLMGAAVTNFWVPQAVLYTLMGLAGGVVLGVLGLMLTRWEATSRSLHYTPNRWLVLGITLIVTARVMYGFWRGWQSWRLGLDGGSWLVVSGVAGSLAAGAVVLGYYFTYWIGVRRRITRQPELFRRSRHHISEGS
jgi:hypothetical protein